MKSPAVLLPRTGRAAVGAVATLLVALLIGTPAPGASASTRSKLNSAKAQLASVTARISSEQASLANLQAQLAAVQASITQVQAKVDAISSNLAWTQGELATAQAEDQRLHDEMDALVRTAYVQGPLGSLEMVLGASSISNLNDRIQFVGALTQQDADVAEQIANVEAQLTRQKATLAQLLSEQGALLNELNQQQQAKDAAIAAQQQTIANLNALRTQAVDLVSKLRKQLRAEELAAVSSVFQGGSHVSYGTWAGLFLSQLGASHCHANMVAMVSWQVAEFTQAAWNPLATTYHMSGSTSFNGSGVQNYRSLGQGLTANRLTLGLSGHGYQTIVSSLSACADAMATARAVNASDWCGGCAGGRYVLDMVPKVEADYATYAAL